MAIKIVWLAIIMALMVSWYIGPPKACSDPDDECWW